MTKIKVKYQAPSKGGKRVPTKLKYGTQRLLKVLWQKFGGVHKLKLLSGYTEQKFIHWRNKGKVSFKVLGPVARKLGISVEALNYEGVGSLVGSSMAWNILLKDSKALGIELTENELEYIKKGIDPKPYEGD